MVSNFSSQIDLKIVFRKKHRNAATHYINTRLVAEGIVIEQVDTFTYLGSVVSTTDPTEK